MQSMDAFCDQCCDIDEFTDDSVLYLCYIESNIDLCRDTLGSVTDAHVHNTQVLSDDPASWTLPLRRSNFDRHRSELGSTMKEFENDLEPSK